MTDEYLLDIAQTSTAVMLAYFRKPRLAGKAADDVFMALCDRTFGECKSEAQVSRAELMEATGLTQSTVSVALGKLLDAGLITRRSPGHKQAFIYRIERDAVLQAAA